LSFAETGGKMTTGRETHLPALRPSGPQRHDRPSASLLGTAEVAPFPIILPGSSVPAKPRTGQEKPSPDSATPPPSNPGSPPRRGKPLPSPCRGPGGHRTKKRSRAGVQAPAGETAPALARFTARHARRKPSAG